MPIDILASFVDRGAELALFHSALAGATHQRILLILEPGEQGKSCFLRRLAHECERKRPPVPAVLLDFDQRRSGLTDFMSVAREVRRDLGDALTPAICACEEAIRRPAPLVNIQTGSGEAGVDWGRGGRFSEAAIAGVAGRDSITVGPVSGGLPSAPPQAQQRADTGRALLSDLSGAASTWPRLVVLIDTFDCASDETCRWLNDWLFEPLRRELSHVLVVVAGRPDCRPFFEQAHLWGGLVRSLRFDPLQDEHIVEHFRLRGISLAEEEMSLLVEMARQSPARMALLGDWAVQTRGGR